MAEFKIDPGGYQNKLLAEHGSYVTVEPAGYVPEVIHRSVWEGWTLGSEDGWRRQRNVMMNGTDK